ncbi:MAG: alpha/beta hydrolase [Varibaculum sp.]|nr:alpha/beta hydrolase [Varibaculum sp.]
MEPYLRPELLSVIAQTPPQTPWDLPALRGAGDELFGGLRPALGDTKLQVTTIADAAGGSIELRCLSPKNGIVQAVMVAIHGGGYVAGRAEFDDARNAELATALQTRIYSPEYRLAPEHPFPAGIADCLAAITYAAEQAGDAGAPLYVFGDSAGAGLAYLATLKYCATALPVEPGNREHPKPVAGLILFEPCLDPRSETDSMRTHGDGPVWTRRANQVAWQLATPDPKIRGDVITALNPAAIPDSFPRTLVVANPADPLRDEGVNLARNLIDGGVETELHIYPGTFHGALSIPHTPVWGEIKELLRRFCTQKTA